MMFIDGTDFDDFIIGTHDDDEIHGFGGNDWLNGKNGIDTMYGGNGNDTYVVGQAGDRVTETSAIGGLDTVRSYISYTLGANVERLTLVGTKNVNGFGNELVNLLVGNSGANLLDGGAGADSMYGGDGNDTYVRDDLRDKVIETNPDGGIDLVLSAKDYTLGANVERLTLTGTADLDGRGNELVNLLRGNSGANMLDGGAGADSMYGGDGNDTYVVDNVGDKVFETYISSPYGNQVDTGLDLVLSSISWALNDGTSKLVENLTLTGTADIEAFGNTLNNVITGNAGSNVLDGKAGNDIMIGGDGDDIYYCDRESAVRETSATGGTDLVYAMRTFRMGEYVENLTFIAGGAVDQDGFISGYANDQANVMVGNSVANRLVAFGGDDTLDGAGGNDALHSGMGNDVVMGGSGADRFYFETELSAAANVDTILDFDVLDDAIVLDLTIFADLGSAGTLAASAFHTGTAAQEADDRVIYDEGTGRIFYDVDGGGGADAVLFAQVNAGTSLSNADFLLMA